MVEISLSLYNKRRGCIIKSMYHRIFDIHKNVYLNGYYIYILLQSKSL